MHSVHDDRIQVIDEKAIDKASQLEDYFIQEIEAGLEGLVVKKKDAPYQAGRRNFKKKKEYLIQTTLLALFAL